MIDDVVQMLGTITVSVNCTTSKIPTIKLADLQWNDFELYFNNQIKSSLNLLQSIVSIMEKKGYVKL